MVLVLYRSSVSRERSWRRLYPHPHMLRRHRSVTVLLRSLASTLGLRHCNGHTTFCGRVDFCIVTSAHVGHRNDAILLQPWVILGIVVPKSTRRLMCDSWQSRKGVTEGKHHQYQHLLTKLGQAGARSALTGSGIREAGFFFCLPSALV